MDFDKGLGYNYQTKKPGEHLINQVFWSIQKSIQKLLYNGDWIGKYILNPFNTFYVTSLAEGVGRIHNIISYSASFIEQFLTAFFAEGHKTRIIYFSDNGYDRQGLNSLTNDERLISAHLRDPMFTNNQKDGNHYILFLLP
jgi:hypothetical protein